MITDLFSVVMATRLELTFLRHVVHAVSHGRVLLFSVQEEEAGIIVDKVII